jgi:hypothetical protein
MASPHMMRLFLIAALLAALRPTSSSWSSSGTSPEPVLTFCSGQPLDSNSSPAVTSGGEFTSFLDAVCAGAYGVAHMSHNMSWYAAGTNRTGSRSAAPTSPSPTTPSASPRRPPVSSPSGGRRAPRPPSGTTPAPPLLRPRPKLVPRGRVHGDHVQRDPRTTAIPGRQGGGEVPSRRRREQHDEQPHVPRRRPNVRAHAVHRWDVV